VSTKKPIKAPAKPKAPKTTPKTPTAAVGAAKATTPTPTPKAKPGRPSKFTPVLVERVCSLIASGKSLRAIGDMPDMPTAETVRTWLHRDAEFSGQYARACEARAEHYAEEIIDIADTETDPQRARNRIDARKWTAVKLLPKKYGDRVDVTGRLTYEQLVGASLKPTE